MMLVCIPVGNIASFGRFKRLVFFYDLRICTYRFDALMSILIASEYCALKQKKQFDFVIYDPTFGSRQDGPVRSGSSENERLHYLTSIIFESISLFPNLGHVHYVRSFSDLLNLWFGYKFQTVLPKFYSPVLPTKSYSWCDLLTLSGRKGPPLPTFPTSSIFDEKVSQFIESEKISERFATITIRQKSWEKCHWNLEHFELKLFVNVIDSLRKARLVNDVILIFDFENPYDKKCVLSTEASDFKFSPEASLSVRFRASLYKASSINFCSTNGPSLLALLTESHAFIWTKIIGVRMMRRLGV